LKRQDLMEFLKEVLRVCSDLNLIEMVWVKKADSIKSQKQDDYQLVIKSTSSLDQEECLTQVNEKFRMKMEKQGDLWLFSSYDI
jgi:hypothetical protein